MAVDPVLGVVTFDIALANFAIWPADCCQDLLSIHAEIRALLGDGLLHLRRQRGGPLYGRGTLLREVQYHSQILLQLIGGHVRQATPEIKVQRRARFLSDNRLAVFVSSRGT